MATHNNSKPAAELRIGTVKATVWKNEVGGITHHNVTFSRIYPEGGQWKTSQSFRFVNVLSVAKLADQAHTLIGERKAEAAPAAGDSESQLSAAPCGGGLKPAAFWKAVPARGRHALSETITAGSEIGLAGGLGRGLDEDDGCGLWRIRGAGTVAEKLSFRRL